MKKGMKSLFVALVLTMGLGACGNNNSSTSEPVNLSSSGVNVNNYVNDHYNEENFTFADKVVNTTKLVTYDGPQYLNESSKVDIKVNNQDLFVYETRVNHERKFTWDASFDTAPAR